MGKTVRNQVEFRVTGSRALFTDPVIKASGEKYSYNVPTYSALKGLMDAIYWKPSIKWVIDEVRVVNKIRMESIGVLGIKHYDSGRQLNYHTYLRNVEYHVRAHFEFNKENKHLYADFNEHKHFDIAKRSIKRGGRRRVFLGTSECYAYVTEVDYEKESGYYENAGDVSFGTMLHSIMYRGEGENDIIGLWRPVMKNGVIKFIRPEDCPIKREVYLQKN